MKKHLYLIPVLALSLAALAGCDDKKQENPTPETTSESAMPAAPEVDPAEAEAQAQASVVISNAFSYATGPSATNGAVFAKIVNTQGKADFLLSARTDVAGTVEIHQTYEDPQTGATIMRKTSGADVPSKGELLLEPNGYHLMLLDLKRPLVGGETYDVTLTFREAGDVVVPVTVVTVGAEELQQDHTSHKAAPDTGDTSTEIAPVTEDVPSSETPAAPAKQTTETPANGEHAH